MSVEAGVQRQEDKRAVGGPVVAGIDLGGTKVDLAIADLDGVPIASTRLATNPEQGAAEVMTRALDALDELAAGRRLAAVAIGVPGVVDGKRVSLASNIPGLNTLDVVDIVEERFEGTAVLLLNDLNAAAFAELHGGALTDVDTAIIIGLGTGIAAGVIVNGALQKGASDAAGEIGFAQVTLPPGSTPGVDGPQRVTLENAVSGGALDRLAHTVGLGGASELLDRVSTDESVRSLVMPRLEALVSVLGVCCHLLSPTRLVIFGGLAGNRVVQEFVDRELARTLSLPVEIVWARSGDNAAVRGALHQAALLARER